MKFRKIPKNRYLQLDVEKLKNMGYDVNAGLFLELKSAGIDYPVLRLKQGGGSVESLGRVWITPKGRMKIPSRLDLYTRCSINYDSEYLHFIIN